MTLLLKTELIMMAVTTFSFVYYLGHKQSTDHNIFWTIGDWYYSVFFNGGVKI